MTTEPGEPAAAEPGQAAAAEPGQAVAAEGGTAAPAESRLTRAAGLSYVEIPVRDAGQSAAFYRAVFGWQTSGDQDMPSFEDGSGHVAGRWNAELPAAGEAGVIVYVYVRRVDDALWKVTEHGGEIVKPPYPDGERWVATFRDPAGNVLGVWQRGPRY